MVLIEETTLYFAYGSNMNLHQMEDRCPDAQVVGNVHLEGYRLAFRGNGSGCGVATILPEPGSRVEGVLWRVSGEDERNLDCYEGYPRLYGKETIRVQDRQGENYEVMVYTMQPPYKECPATPSQSYLRGILQGCQQNGLAVRPVLEAVRRTQMEQTVPKQYQQESFFKPPRRKSNPER